MSSTSWSAKAQAHLLPIVLLSMILLVAGFILLSVVTRAEAQEYLTVLEPTGPEAGVVSVPLHVDGDMFVGSVQTPTGHSRAYRWSSCVYSPPTPRCPILEPHWTDLGTLGGSSSIAHAISHFFDYEHGHTSSRVVGTSQTSDGGTYGFLWRDGVMEMLGGFGWSDAKAVSRKGNFIAGTGRERDGRIWPVVWDSDWPPAAYMNPALEPSPPEFPAIQPFGVEEFNGSPPQFRAVGRARRDGIWHAFLWMEDGLRYLSTLPGGIHAAAHAINGRGDVAGDAQTATNEWHAVLWEYGTAIRDLGTLGGSYSTATAMDRNQPRVVGVSTTPDGNDHPFVWTPISGMRNLNSLIPPASGWSLREPRAVGGRYVIGSGVLNGESKDVVLRDDAPPTWTDGRLWLADAVNTRVRLAWSGAHDTFGIMRYQLFVNGAPYRQDIEWGSFADVIVTPGQTYTFKVEASDGYFSTVDGPSLTLTVPDGPNLAVTALTAVSSPTGQTASETTQNKGTQSVPGSTTRFYAVGNASRYPVGSRTVPSLIPKGSSTAQTRLTLSSVPPGRYSVIACADAPQSIVETNEADNCSPPAGRIYIPAIRR